MSVDNFDARTWSWYIAPPRDLWRNPIPTGQLHEASPAVLRRRAATDRRIRRRATRARIWWNLRAPLRYLGRLGGLTDHGEE